MQLGGIVERALGGLRQSSCSRADASKLFSPSRAPIFSATSYGVENSSSCPHEPRGLGQPMASDFSVLKCSNSVNSSSSSLATPNESSLAMSIVVWPAFCELRAHRQSCEIRKRKRAKRAHSSAYGPHRASAAPLRPPVVGMMAVFMRGVAPCKFTGSTVAPALRVARQFRKPRHAQRWSGCAPWIWHAYIKK